MYADPLQFDAPRWSGQAQQRLHVSLVMSAICLVTLVLVLRFPVAEQSRPLTELLVRILVEDVETATQPEVIETVQPLPEEKLSPVPPQEAATDVAEPVASSRDFYVEIPAAVAATLDNVPKEYTVNPVFDEKRRAAAEQFYPSRAPVRKPIWENVEKDTLGRSVLWSGDCYRVIDDPNAGSREAFEIFGQHIVSCLYRKEPPKELPWVEEIRSRRASQARYGPRVAE